MLTTDAEYRVDAWAYQSYVPDVAVRAARASLPHGMVLDVKGGDLVAIDDDGEVVLLDEICPDLLDLLKPQTAREALLGVLSEKPLPVVTPRFPRLEDIPMAPESAKQSVDRVLRQRKAFSEGIEWQI